MTRIVDFVRDCKILAASLALVIIGPCAGAHAGNFRVIYSFCAQSNCADGYYPSAGLINVNGKLYGTASSGTAGNGVVFSIDPTTGAETVVYNFCTQPGCADGADPQSGLISVGSILYGTTIAGGTHSSGTVFSIDLTTGVETVIYSFCSKKHCNDGLNPVGGLIHVNGSLYGTTTGGGVYRYDAGTAFSINLSTRRHTVLHAFGIGADGRSPDARLLNVKGTLFGTTPAGGQINEGTVFSLDRNTGAERIVYTFCVLPNCADGRNPSGGLIDVNGRLYGTTSGGGEFGKGTVFSIDPTTGAETVLYSFGGRSGDGANPAASLIDVASVLYGTTPNGAHGTVFSVTLSGSERTLHVFTLSTADEGLAPYANLININGTLYGTTTQGGRNTSVLKDGGGTVFAITP